MERVIDTLLLLALPASGKSEVRRYLANVDERTGRTRFHIGSTVQLDDYPYVHLMRRVDEELAAMGERRAFFEAADRSFATTLDWGTLIALLNEDFAALRVLSPRETDRAASRLFERFDCARAAVGAPRFFCALLAETRRRLEDRLEAEAAALAEDWNSSLPASLEGSTVVIEFARGGPLGAYMPLTGGYGYRYSLSLLSNDILARAAILYIWVTPEQSRAKNSERARPNADGSILFHGVPNHVMINDYGCDDMEHLIGESGAPDSVRVQKGNESFMIPTARFDNRDDLTTFLRADINSWREEDIAKLDAGMSTAMSRIWTGYSARLSNRGQE